jgi:hypothetical protein
LIGAGSLAAGGAAAIGTGAVDSTRANRDISVDVVGDKNAYLSLDPDVASTSEFVNVSGGEISFNFSGNGSASGVNQDAVTAARPALRLSNLYDQEMFVEVWNPFRNSDMTSSANNTRAGGTSVDIPAGLDVQFIAVSSGTANDLDQNPDAVALIDRDGAIPTGAGENSFDLPSNAYIISDPAEEKDHSGTAVQFTDGSGNKNDNTGYISLSSGETVDIIVRVVADNLDRSQLPEFGPVYFEAFSDESEMTTSPASDSTLYASGGGT